MKGKIFTPVEANQMLPLVSRIADDIVRTYGEVTAALEAFEAARQNAQSHRDSDNEDMDAELELRARDAQVAAKLDAFQSLIEEIEALGGTVKDYERGLLDFYGEVDGEIVYLCWQRGEPYISHWHRLEEGFGQRQALPVVAPAA